jgi:hydrogenase maturation protease
VKRLRVLGIGSPFGEDRFGWEAIDRLRRTPRRIPGWTMEFDALDRPGPGLLEKMAGADGVILIDAVQSGAPPGSAFALDRGQLLRAGDRFSSHALGVAEVLALGEKLEELPPRLGLIGIEAGGHIAEQLSAVFDEQVRRLIGQGG